jgi:hypothetical protein
VPRLVKHVEEEKQEKEEEEEKEKKKKKKEKEKRTRRTYFDACVVFNCCQTSERKRGVSSATSEVPFSFCVMGLWCLGSRI